MYTGPKGAQRIDNSKLVEVMSSNTPALVHSRNSYQFGINYGTPFPFLIDEGRSYRISVSDKKIHILEGALTGVWRDQDKISEHYRYLQSMYEAIKAFSDIGYSMVRAQGAYEYLEKTVVDPRQRNIEYQALLSKHKGKNPNDILIEIKVVSLDDLFK